MSLDTVVEDIRAEAEREREEILEAARERAEEIRQEAREDAETIREDASEDAEAEVEQRRRQRVSAAKLEAKQTRLEARRDVLEDVHDQVEAAVAGLQGERRRRLTEALLSAAAGEFDDEELRVFGSPDDADLLETVVDDAEMEATVAGEYDCLGGVVVEGTDSRVRVNNTFDSVLEGVWEDQLKEVSDRLFADVEGAEPATDDHEDDESADDT